MDKVRILIKILAESHMALHSGEKNRHSIAQTDRPTLTPGCAHAPEEEVQS